MDWKGGRRSDNVDDQRNNSSFSAGSTGGVAILLRLLPFLLSSKIGRILLLIGGLGYVGAHYLGIDFMQLLGGTQVRSQAHTNNTGDDELVDFVSVILADTEDTWKTEFKKMGRIYREPVLVLFKNRVNSACGLAAAATGPFYCPGDNKLYIDLAFYQQMKTTLGAPGDFAQAYVIAHEVGHHVQNLLGISDKVTQAQRSTSQTAANALSVKLELQADCFAGVWGHNTQQRGHLESGDVDEGLAAAAAVGDDRIQRQARGYMSPESFTHGSSAQRAQWFRSGFDSGDLKACDTFSAQ